MMYDYSKLIGRIKEKGYTQEALAEKIDITGTTLNKKLHNYSSFSQPEMIGIANALEFSLADIPSYFFVKALVKNTSD